jgi:rSAM/selenodomain-associated transferase 1
MTKAPQAGSSKTRLTPPLTAAEAARLSACFLRDTCDNITRISAEGAAAGVAVYTPASTEKLFHDLLPQSFGLVAQRGASFGQRLFHAAEDLIAVGYDSLCLIDSDSPTLPAEFLRAAVRALSRPGDRAVLGPARDGGYYLIGLKQAHRRLFEDIDWSTARVLRQTLARAKESKLPVTILPSWFDVDDATTLRQLCDELFPMNGKLAMHSDVLPYHAPHTRGYLARILATDPGRQILWRHNVEAGKSAWTGVEDAP